MQKAGVLFFDLDGTIANSGYGITASMNEAFSQAGLGALSPIEIRRIIGPPLQTTMPELLTTRDVGLERVDFFIDQYRQIYRQQYLDRTPIFEGMAEVLNVLAGSWHLCVVTAKPQSQADIAVRAVGVDHHMVTVVGPKDDAPLPKARLLEKAFANVEKTLGVHPRASDCWMIGDRHHDIEAGLEVGTKTIGVLWGFGDHEELHGAGAHHIASQPAEILGFLSQ